MRITKLLNPAGLLPAILLSPWAHAHPGHTHSPGLLARLVHSITEWGPLLALLVLGVAVGYGFWQARGK